jgi:mRNA-degrading endonuclease RelE of RelBE toxin-antitoxin system
MGVPKTLQSPTFAKQKKKLKKNQIKKLDEAVKAIMANLDIGDFKKGDLQGIRGYKYKVGNNFFL